MTITNITHALFELLSFFFDRLANLPENPINYLFVFPVKLQWEEECRENTMFEDIKLIGDSIDLACPTVVNNTEDLNVLIYKPSGSQTCEELIEEDKENTGGEEDELAAARRAGSERRSDVIAGLRSGIRRVKTGSGMLDCWGGDDGCSYRFFADDMESDQYFRQKVRRFYWCSRSSLSSGYDLVWFFQRATSVFATR